MTEQQFHTTAEQAITMSELKSELAKIKKRDQELNFRAQKTEEYLTQFSLLSKKDVDELTKKLNDLAIPRLKIEHIVKIIDVLPDNSEEVKVVLQGTTVSVTKENLKRIADVVSEYKPKKA